MDALAHYHGLMSAPAPERADPFDRHVLAGILAMAMAEADGDPARLLDGLGLDGGGLLAVLDGLFPAVTALYQPLAAAPAPARGEDEAMLADLLFRTSSARTPFQWRLAILLARRAQRPNHLWQDLGLRHRGDLSTLMQRHFAPLARRNGQDMKWKKFLYRTICRDEGYGFCTAPSCADCDDFQLCFGDESGDSLLARRRRESEQATAGAADTNSQSF